MGLSKGGRAGNGVGVSLRGIPAKGLLFKCVHKLLQVKMKLPDDVIISS